MRRLIAVLLPLALAAPALAQGVQTLKTAQLDRDTALESLVPEIKRDRFGFEQRQAVLRDRGCRARVLMGPHDVLAELRAREIDGRGGRKEILVEGRDGAAGRAGVTRVLRKPDGCRRPRVLFDYSSATPDPPPPSGYDVASYGARVTRGQIEVTEDLARDGEPAVSAEESRQIIWRYDRISGRFEVDIAADVQPE